MIANIQRFIIYSHIKSNTITFSKSFSFRAFLTERYCLLIESLRLPLLFIIYYFHINNTSAHSIEEACHEFNTKIYN
jgi:hypothetical protein